MKKVTDRQIALEFGLSVQTLCTWKKGTEEQIKRYRALKNAVMADNLLIWEIELTDGTVEIINDEIIGVYTIQNNTKIRIVKKFKPEENKDAN